MRFAYSTGIAVASLQTDSIEAKAMVLASRCSSTLCSSSSGSPGHRVPLGGSGAPCLPLGLVAPKTGTAGPLGVLWHGSPGA